MEAAPEEKKHVQMLLKMVSDRKKLLVAKGILGHRLTILRDEVTKWTTRNQELKGLLKWTSRDLDDRREKLQSIKKQRADGKILILEEISQSELMQEKVVEAERELFVSKKLMEYMNLLPEPEEDGVPESEEDGEADDKNDAYLLNLVEECCKHRPLLDRNMYDVIEITKELKSTMEALQAAVDDNMRLKEDLHKSKLELQYAKQLSKLLYEEMQSLDNQVLEMSFERNSEGKKVDKLKERVAATMRHVEKLKSDFLRRRNLSLLGDIEKVNITELPELEDLRGILLKATDAKEDSLADAHHGSGQGAKEEDSLAAASTFLPGKVQGKKVRDDDEQRLVRLLLDTLEAASTRGGEQGA